MNTQILSLTKTTIDSNDKLVGFVEKAKAVSIPLFPETVSFDIGYKFGAGIVTVNTQLDNFGNNRDIYRNESGGYCLHLAKLNEIAQQAGIRITDSRIMERKTDENGLVTYISHQITGEVKSVDGSIKRATVTGKYDYYNDVATKKEGQVKSRRKHADALAESNAMTRLYNKLLAKIPSNFTLDELKKPFLIPYVLEDKNELIKELPPEEQIAIKKELVRKRLGLLAEIYPGTTTKTANKIEDAEVLVAEDVDVSGETSVVDTEDLANVMTRDEAETYRSLNQSERTKRIAELCVRKGVKNPNNSPIRKEQIEKKTVDQQIDTIEWLLNRPDVEEFPL